MKLSLSALTALNWCAHVLLALGLSGPCMTITPDLAPVRGPALWLGLVDEPASYSVLDGTWQLLSGGNVAIGAVLLIFSVLIPIGKLLIIRLAIDDVRRGRPPGRGHRLAARFSKFSMVDVFVVAVLVVAGKTFPGGTTIDPAWGIFAFAAAALLSTYLSIAVAGHVEASS